MADVINRTTGEIRRSVDTPKFPDADWLPLDRVVTDMLEAIPQKHRVVEGDTVREATQAEKDAIAEDERQAEVQRVEALDISAEEVLRALVSTLSAARKQEIIDKIKERRGL